MITFTSKHDDEDGDEKGQDDQSEMWEQEKTNGRRPLNR